MRWLALFGGLMLGTVPGIGQSAAAPVQEVSGTDTYRTYCATCHGAKGQGDGPLAESLRSRPPDLTLLAKDNGGTFPTTKVVRIVDGREPLRGHGGPDMPVWGDVFKNAGGGSDDEQVKQRIQSVVAHLERLQEK